MPLFDVDSRGWFYVILGVRLYREPLQRSNCHTSLHAMRIDRHEPSGLNERLGMRLPLRSVEGYVGCEPHLRVLRRGGGRKQPGGVDGGLGVRLYREPLQRSNCHTSLHAMRIDRHEPSGLNERLGMRLPLRSVEGYVGCEPHLRVLRRGGGRKQPGGVDGGLGVRLHRELLQRSNCHTSLRAMRLDRRYESSGLHDRHGLRMRHRLYCQRGFDAALRLFGELDERGCWW